MKKERTHQSILWGDNASDTHNLVARAFPFRPSRERAERTRLVEKGPVISHCEALGFEKFEQNIEVPNSLLEFVARYQNKKFTIFTASGNVQIKKEVKSLEYFSILLTSVSSSIRKIFLTSRTQTYNSIQRRWIIWTGSFILDESFLQCYDWDKLEIRHYLLESNCLLFSKRRCIDENIFDQILCLL